LADLEMHSRRLSIEPSCHLMLLADQRLHLMIAKDSLQAE